MNNLSEELAALLDGEELLAVPDVSERLGVVVTKVHDLLNTNKLVAYVVDGKKYIPAVLLDGDELNKFVGSAVTVLKDNHFTDEEILRFLFTPDDTLPGRPVDALHGHGAREVIRRAQAMAF
ncbi:Rv2175c family DNA-binding protein [Corynebacterium lubricantis]|uniref:Rv2175c family DNA-binding protein n=1 Tax=Corynebacterium lubricantis TaxID=541095 RepID=UPI000367DBFE|nr:Rv2175c family DNA-binding protein [Corynebacterium lubricantis]